jgi:hypothetical protein
MLPFNVVASPTLLEPSYGTLIVGSPESGDPQEMLVLRSRLIGSDPETFRSLFPENGVFGNYDPPQIFHGGQWNSA